MRSVWRVAVSVALVGLAGCNSLPQNTGTTTDTSTQSPTRIAKRAPIPTRPLNVKTDCKFKNDTGYNGKAQVDVLQGEVRKLEAEINIPGRGQCRFSDSNFKQTQVMPTPELLASNGCTVRVWEQGNVATVAFSNCAAMCAPRSAFDYVWPILIDRPRNHCD